ncbi:MAG: hypothetical protein ACPG0L_01510 [Bacteroidia bacterium]|jgi:hypothetical protein
MKKWLSFIQPWLEQVKPTKKWESIYLVLIFPIPGSSILYGLYAIYKLVERRITPG